MRLKLIITYLVLHCHECIFLYLFANNGRFRYTNMLDLCYDDDIAFCINYFYITI